MVKKSFWLLPEHAKWVEKHAKTGTESKLMRDLIEEKMHHA